MMIMDPISTMHSLYTLANSVKTWLDAREEKDATISSISATVTRISDVVAPLQGPAAKALDPTILAAFLGICDVLCRTREHLIAWGAVKPVSLTGITVFLDPAHVTRALKEDERDLNSQLVMMLFTLTMKEFFRNTPGTSSEPKEPKGDDRFYLGTNTNEEVAVFWRDYIGAKVLWASSDTFFRGIKEFVDPNFSDEACKRMQCYLDEHGIGGIARSSFERSVGQKGLAKFVQQFQNKTLYLRGAPKSNDSRLPLLLWVDDHPEYNFKAISSARSNGISVIVVSSTTLAKNWIDNNEDLLRNNDSASRIRVISDNARLEFVPKKGSHGGSFLNISAGETIIRYLRGRVYRIPVLIYCNKSLPYTQYVQSYTMTGSTRDKSVVNDYIKSLSAGDDNDAAWRRFGAVGNTTSAIPNNP